MNREALDEFFAKADDVLTNWHGGTDAMHGAPPADEDALPPRADSYYEQSPFARSDEIQRRLDALTEAILRPREPDEDGSVTYTVSGPLFDPSDTVIGRAAHAAEAGETVSFLFDPDAQPLFQPPRRWLVEMRVDGGWVALGGFSGEPFAEMTSDS